MPKRLTNEAIKKNFDNQFDLVNYLIKLAENMIHTQREPRVKVEAHSQAMAVLEETIAGKDFLDDIQDDDLEESGKYSTASETVVVIEEAETADS